MVHTCCNSCGKRLTQHEKLTIGRCESGLLASHRLMSAVVGAGRQPVRSTNYINSFEILVSVHYFKSVKSQPKACSLHRVTRVPSPDIHKYCNMRWSARDKFRFIGYRGACHLQCFECCPCCLSLQRIFASASIFHCICLALYVPSSD